MHQEEKPSYFRGDLNKAGALDAALPFLLHAQGDAAFSSLLSHQSTPGTSGRENVSKEAKMSCKNRFLFWTSAEIHNKEWVHILNAALIDRYLSLVYLEIWQVCFDNSSLYFALNIGQSRRKVFGAGLAPALPWVSALSWVPFPLPAPVTSQSSSAEHNMDRAWSKLQPEPLMANKP